MATTWFDTLPGSGEMLSRLRAHDWASTPLGPPETWPERLRGAVSLALSSRFPLMVAWGPDLVQVYNDGYLPIFGEKHPQLGVPIRETWSEIWDVVGPMLQGVLDTREATWAVDQCLWIDRLGFAEDTYFTFSYSPVLDGDGVARGVLATAMETTERVVAGRRAATLGAIVPGRATSAAQAARVALGQLAAHPDDVPFAAVFLRDPTSGYALAASTIVDQPLPAWPLHLAADLPVVVEVPDELSVLHEAAGRRVRQAALVRLGDHGVLVCGLSPGRRVDAPHLAFLTTLGTQVQASMALGKAFADERQRAEERLAAERATVEREAEERSAAAAERFRFAGARLGTWTLDLVSGEAFLDENLERMFGVPPGTMNSFDDVMDRIEPSYHERINAALAGIPESGGEFFVDFEVLRPDGSRRAFQSRGAVAPDERGQARLLHGALWDATQLLEAQAAARESEERLRSALEYAPWGIAVVEPDGRISSANHALCELTGRPQDDLVGSPFRELVHDDDDDPLAEAGAGAAREVRLHGPQCTSTWVSLSSAPVRAEDGRLLHRMVHVYDHSERKRLEADLQRLADQDPLTGLLNRRRFSEELERALKQAGRDEGGVVLMIDMDGLKRVNDTLGHTVGDALLVALADALRTRLRETDVPARLGGDEFAAVLPRIQPEAALVLSQQLIEHFRRSAPLGSAVSVSIGVARLADGGSDRIAEDVMTEADSALYAAKDAGSGQVRVFQRDARSDEAAVHHPRRWTERIRYALDHDGLVLYGQPIRALRSDLSDQEELLLRMVGDDGRLVPPTSFLLAAERSTLILDVDRWVLHEAVRELARRQADDPEARLAVNLSARSLTDPQLIEHVAVELAAAGADPCGLVLEITETAAVVNVAQARSFIRAMSELGCELSLDDFGAGFTSLQYLKHLDFDYLKIDGEFVRDLTTSPVNQSIVRAIADLARSLGKRTVAEHVGDRTSLEWLRAHGVDYAQGFHLGLPRPLGAPDTTLARIPAPRG